MIVDSRLILVAENGSAHSMPPGATVYRLPAVDETNNAEAAKVFAELRGSRGRVSNALRSMGHSPDALRRFAAVGDYVRYRSALSARVREITIVVTGRLYPYAMAHHAPLAVRAGMTEEQVAELMAGKVPSTFTDPLDISVARYVLEFVSPASVSDATFNALKAVASPQQITDITMTSAYFVALAMTITAFGVEVDPDEQLKDGFEWQQSKDAERAS